MIILNTVVPTINIAFALMLLLFMKEEQTQADMDLDSWFFCWR